MKELANKINYFSTSFVAILGFSLISEIFMETDWDDKFDDILFLIVSIAGIVWYRKSGAKSDKSLGSVILVGIAFLTKVLAVVIEHADKEAVGDDIGVGSGIVNRSNFCNLAKRQAKKSMTTTFKEKVYALAREIPKGKVATYGQLAKLAGNKNAARAVGVFMKMNPDAPHTPCHRVVASTGELTGYSAKGGVKTKRAMLIKEGVVFKKLKVDLVKSQWQRKK